jgi:Flp pilus assembly pilin Flp
MKCLRNLKRRFLSDERGAEVVELGIVLALVVAGAVAIISQIGPKIVSAYQTVLTALGG